MISKAVGGPVIGKGVVYIDCGDLAFENVVVSQNSRHGHMQDITRHTVRQDMATELNRS